MVEPDDRIKNWDPHFSKMATQDQCPYFDFDSDLSFVLQTPLIPPYQLHQMQYVAAMEDYHTQSSGYLQDAVVDWTDRCKRRRMLYFPPDEAHTNSDDYSHLWQEELDSNFAWFSQDNISNTLSGLLPSYKNEEHGAVSVEKELTISTIDEDVTWAPSKLSISGEEKSKVERRRKMPLKVAYPFAVVKPSGVQGDVTLSDINKRILKRPTRPIQHPVGEFARLPCASERGSGLSGKAVIALTKIRTQGKGTITIIRTRG